MALHLPTPTAHPQSHPSPFPHCLPSRASAQPPPRVLQWPCDHLAIAFILPHLFEYSSRPAPFQIANIPHATLAFSDAFTGGLRQDGWISRLRGRQFGSLCTCFLSQSSPCSRYHGDSEGPSCHPGQRYKILRAALLAQGLSGTDLAFMGTAVM